MIIDRYTKAENVIPPITHELGSSWEQPSLREILISDRYAMVSRRAFEQLHEYSSTNPTAVYEGKMWKRNKLIPVGHGAYRKTDIWWLVWYGEGKEPNTCSINTRLILLP